MSEQYLRNALAKYRYADIAKRDVTNLTRQFPDLKPKLDNYIFTDGAQKELLQLEGTIPVNYKGTTYNIPVSIWLVDTHPYNPPMCYVKPTSTMLIRPSKHVDANGKIYLPYLHEWKQPASDVVGLVQIMCIVFGEMPPVYSKPTSSPQSSYSQQQGHTGYPTGQGYMQMPQPGQPAGQYNPGYPTPYSNYNPQQYPGSSGYQQPPAGYPGYTPSSSGQSPGYPGATHQQSSPYYAGAGTAATGNTNTVTEEHLRASILSAVQDKMHRRLKEVFAQAQAEMDALKKTQEDLNKGKDRLEQIINSLEEEQVKVDQNVVLLKEKSEELKKLLGKMEEQEQVDIDDAVVTTAPLYKQSGEVYLKHVRELSREQFMLRALMKKCRDKAGLVEVTQPMRF
ncbi:PREDICTED: tumor susceptibility gene 101 protein-like [Priapulus caudatus]|uniref:Tumor susceptibility gene 101 protein-like n=1 Tax=Priapulus caudatus TaxID=37621 RepID=A0ABM1F096_PRICU|nr:PREDICTED: tumor susceptibility gene 101 protein-like [Priapulus caudatus]